MKKLILISIVMTCFMTNALSQNKVKGTLYKADSWADIIANGGFIKALDSPTYEKVEVFLTEKYIKVTFGTKISNYVIVSTKKFSESKMDYTVTKDSKTYVLSIAIMPTGKTAINIEKVWFIPEVKNITEIK